MRAALGVARGVVGERRTTVLQSSWERVYSLRLHWGLRRFEFLALFQDLFLPFCLAKGYGEEKKEGTYIWYWHHDMLSFHSYRLVHHRLVSHQFSSSTVYN